MKARPRPGNHYLVAEEFDVKIHAGEPIMKKPRRGERRGHQGN